jgi:prepilin-type N-terminal cleavage/methylation domain-containing protein
MNTVRGRSSLTGFTLVEVMIALIIMLVVFLALMQTALVGIDSNMINTLRNEAVNIAEIRMNEARNKPFVSLDADPGSPSSDYLDGGCTSGCNDCPPTGFSTGKCWCRDVRSISGFKFCTNLTCAELGGDGNCATDDIGADNKQVNITVGWKWKGENYTHSITTVRGK